MDFKILGPLEVREGDRRLSCKGPKQRLLLAALLLRAGETVSSDRLIEALWGESPPETADKALQVHVSQLRKLLEPERTPGSPGRILVTRPPGYVLNADPDQVDLHRFEQTAAQARAEREAGRTAEAAALLRRALALWRGPPLSDLSFESHLQADIARLEELRLAALEDRLDADLALGRHGEVTAELEGLVSGHPLRERLRAQLMLSLYRAGRQAEALEVYRAGRRALVDELGIEPGRELRDLERRILAQDPELDVAAPADVCADVDRPAPPQPRLIGREREMAELLTLLDGALAGRGAMAVVAGEPGIGKSRLGEALAAAAQERGAHVLVGRCWEAGGAPPYWPWVQALRSHLRECDRAALRERVGPEVADLVAILPELGELVGDVELSEERDPERARFRLFEAATSFLRGAASERPLTLFLDDLHAADAPSLLLLRFVAGQLTGLPLLLLGFYRDTEAPPMLTEALADLSREPAVHRISLSGLDRPDTARLLEATMGRAPRDELADRIHAETEGNPLFAAEIGRLLSSEGWEDGRRLPIPHGVSEAIGRRLQRRSEECRGVLALASVAGREFALDVLGHASGLSEDELFRALDEAAEARLVGGVPGAAGRLRFSHILVRDVLYEGLPPTRRLRMHREMGDALRTVYAENLEPHLAELAHHYGEAGGGAAADAIDFAARAGHLASSQHAYEEAARHLSDALRTLRTAGRADAERECDLWLALGEALSRAGEDAEAKDALRRAADIAADEGWPDRLARAALEYGGRFSWARASTDPELVPLLERGLKALPEEAVEERVKLLSRLAGALRDEPLRDRRVEIAETALELARRSGDPRTLALALEGHWIATEGPPLVGEGVAVGRRLVALGAEIGDKERAFAGHDFLLYGYWALADRAGVDVELEAVSRLADELGQPAQRWHADTSTTALALMEGRFEEAEGLMEQTLALGRRAQSWNAAVSYRLGLFALRRAQGRLAELEGTIRRSVLEYPALFRFRCALAHLLAQIGAEHEAREALDDVLSHDLAREYLDAEWLFAMNLLPDAVRFLDDEAAAARLHALLLPHEQRYAHAPVEASAGSVARGLGVLATTLRHFDDAERHFEVALEVERRMRARPWLAHARHDLACLLLARAGEGDRQRATALLDDVIGTYRELGMGHWAEAASAAKEASVTK